MKKSTFRGLFTALLGLTLSVPGVRAQQNIQFTQYIFNSLSVNPAYAGYKENWFIQSGLRAQWIGIQDAPKTGQASIDGLIDRNKRMGLGFQITADQLGAQSANSAYVNYSYRLPFDVDAESTLAFGLGVGVSQYGLDYSKLSAIDGGDNTVSQGSTTQSFIPDARVGIYYSTPKWYTGISLMDIFADFDFADKLLGSQNQNEVIRHRRHLYFISGFLGEISDDFKVRPSLLIKEDFKGPTSLDVNSMFIFGDRFWLGASYRTGMKLWKKEYDANQNLTASNSVSGIVQFFVKDNVRIGYSYDYNLNSLSNYSSGSHEVTLGITLPKKIYRSLSPRYF